jgi:acyl carrier protein
MTKMNRFLNLVEMAIVRHVGPKCGSVHASQRLDEDLGLDPLDVILIVIRLEEQAGVEFPVGSLDQVRTVGDLADAIREWQPELGVNLSA